MDREAVDVEPEVVVAPEPEPAAADVVGAHSAGRSVAALLATYGASMVGGRRRRHSDH